MSYIPPTGGDLRVIGCMFLVMLLLLILVIVIGDWQPVTLVPCQGCGGAW